MQNERVTDEMVELKPCPFCGAPAHMEPWHGGAPTKQLITCDSDECDVGPTVTGETPSEAIEKWNRRASSEEKAVEVAVKPLEWVEHPGAFPSPLWSAKTLFGFYSIEESSASDSPAYEVRGNSHRLVTVTDGLPEAKAAAQQDYETRIRSAICGGNGDV